MVDGRSGDRPDEHGADSLRSGIIQAGPLAVAGLVANGANVVVTVVMARLLTTRGYGELAQLTGLFLIVSMPGSAVIVGVVRRIALWSEQGRSELVWRWARRAHRRGTAAVVAFAVIVFLARNWIASELSLPDAVGVTAILVAGAVWVLLCLDRGLLQGHRDYRTLAWNLLVEGGVRTVAMLALVGAGAGVGGAAAGVLIAEVCTAVHARVAADRVWSRAARRIAGGGARTDAVAPDTTAVAPDTTAVAPDTTEPSPGATAPLASATGAVLGAEVAGPRADERPREMALDLFAAFVAMGLLALLQNIDVIVLGRLSPHESGPYAAISVASKALVFGAVALGGYLLPEAAIRWRAGGHALRQLAVTLVLLSVPAVALLAFALAAPHLLLSIVFSSRYLGAASAFGPLALAMVFLSITVVLTMYLLAIGWRWITLILLAGSVAATVAVVRAGGSPHATAVADLVVQVVVAIVTTGAFLRVHRSHLARRAGVLRARPVLWRAGPRTVPPTNA